MPASIRLSQLSLLIQGTLHDAFAFRRFWVIAEISNHSFYAQKGFHYFDMVETENQTGTGKGKLVTRLAAVAWLEGAASIKTFEEATQQRFANGLQVLVELSVDFHPVYGLKLTMHALDHRFSLGLLEQQRMATIQRLLDELPEFVRREDEQLCSFNQDLHLPVVVQRIAVISSATAAGYEDFIHSLQENPFGFQFVVHPYFTSVQGETNIKSLQAGFEKIKRNAVASGLDYDAVVLIRGGGASTDLLLFDQFEIAAAVASCPFPVFTGIGHLKNETLCDLVAHTALKTPTKVAEYILQYNRSFENRLQGIQQMLVIQAQQFMTAARQEFQALKSGLVYQTQHQLYYQKTSLQQIFATIKKLPDEAIRQNQLDLHSTKTRLQSAQKNLITRQDLNLYNLERLFKMASPEKVLQRGFAIVELKGKIISDPAAIQVGDELKVILAETAFETLVKGKKTYDGQQFNL